jgi:nucleotidyltransferase/DNA polymerase involved in DNA repair
MGVKTAKELSRTDPSILEKHFGRKLSSYLLAAASGTDTEPVLANLEPTQFSRIVTLKRDTRDVRDALGQLAEGMTSLQTKLASSGKSFRTISAIGILADLSTRTKSKTFDTPIKDLALIQESTFALFSDLTESTDKNLRRVGVRVSELSDSMDQRSLSEFLQPGW